MPKSALNKVFHIFVLKRNITNLKKIIHLNALLKKENYASISRQIHFRIKAKKSAAIDWNTHKKIIKKSVKRTHSKSCVNVAYTLLWEWLLL